MGSMYILDNSSLSDIFFVAIFSQSVTCFLIPLTLSFTEHKFRIIIKYYWPINYFNSAFGCVAMKVIIEFQSHLDFHYIIY